MAKAKKHRQVQNAEDDPAEDAGFGDNCLKMGVPPTDPVVIQHGEGRDSDLHEAGNMRRAHYGHDLYGALRYGCIRRSREACFKMLAEVRGRMNPMGGAETKPGVVFGMTLHTLIQCAEREGIPTETIRDRIKCEAEGWDAPFGGHQSLDGTALLQFNENMAGAREDPVVTGELGWENYDAEVDAMASSTARATLKEEARLRKQAQTEAAELRKRIDKLTDTQ